LKDVVPAAENDQKLDEIIGEGFDHRPDAECPKAEAKVTVPEQKEEYLCP
jgi:hypothetical protein